MGAKKVRAVIFDWAGTTLDFGSLAPVRTLQRVFEEAGVPITEEEARRDMGLAKRDHIAALLDLPRLHALLKCDVDALYKSFIPLQLACLKQYSALIPGVPQVVASLRTNGIKIGSTTGYTRAMLDLLLGEAANQGYKPDCSLSPEDAGAGRPHPFMLYAAAVKLQVYPLSAMIKVGDTPSDIKEGLNAGTWSVGVAGTGNGIGLALNDFQSLEPEQQAERLRKSRLDLQAAGAHYVIDTLAQLPSVITDVEARLNGATESNGL
jgi:phosphonoacetaldehyde hydrolase